MLHLDVTSSPQAKVHGTVHVAVLCMHVHVYASCFMPVWDAPFEFD